MLKGKKQKPAQSNDGSHFCEHDHLALFNYGELGSKLK